MLRTLWTAASGMTTQQINIDNISNNLANVNTAGFKKSRVNFEDLLYQELKPAGGVTAAGINHPTGIQIGLGSKVVSTEKIFSQGNFQQTGNPLDIAIEGDGFFQVTLPDGTIGYTRNGSFKVDADGNLVTAEGYLLEPNIAIPDNALEIIVGEDGTLSVTLPGEAEPTELGQIELAKFINPSGLRSIGKNIYLQTAASGEPTTGIPGEDGFGTLAQGILEMSNVNVVEEMVNLITGQRAYEINSKAIQTGDEMLQIVNNLKR
ncbi:flagellar basal-body rod protein FlgG [Deferribacter desulfuricans SSM1]|uniref:Flagellar basal-body rod protein FlgG n=1 Tax=Deferribacter desulfuricans (strain DSM 14783 / JCM 11476 / NBRC 101012 / SSM1) TaxID=639282 RepID=D3PA59_DEFDS|nr:flagellar basal-body rod protein FlgG [Deferribacter desulfuricans]BAI81599.1 flagellar basal-body rod protein FlgG [Deferribacter desulfuricans SSM1]